MSLRRNYRGRKRAAPWRPLGRRAAAEGVLAGLARNAAIPILIRLRKVKKKQNQAATYAIAIVRLPSYYLSNVCGVRLRRVTSNKLIFDGVFSRFHNSWETHAASNRPLRSIADRPHSHWQRADGPFELPLRKKTPWRIYSSVR